jgi:predicted nucleotide-binding protein
MSLPIRTTLDDVERVCGYFATKPTGATIADAKAVIDKKHLDGRKLAALKYWGLIEESDGGRIKATPDGRECVRNEGANRAQVLRKVIRSISPYRAIIERLAHRGEDTITATDVAAHWHEHFRSEVSDTDKILNDQAVCFFQLATGSGLGQLTIGRKGSPTRFDVNRDEARHFISSPAEPESAPAQIEMLEHKQIEEEEQAPMAPSADQTRKPSRLGQAIFVAHGKNKKPLEQLKRILDQFKIPYRVAVDEPNLGRPIGAKVREIMQACNCAILIFTADEELTDKEGNSVWRPSENVVFELGASGYLYENRIVIMKEEQVHFPTNFRDLGYIPFAKDELEAKSTDILKELIGFGIVKVST